MILNGEWKNLIFKYKKKHSVKAEHKQTQILNQIAVKTNVNNNAV